LADAAAHAGATTGWKPVAALVDLMLARLGPQRAAAGSSPRLEAAPGEAADEARLPPDRTSARAGRPPHKQISARTGHGRRSTLTLPRLS